MNDKDNMSLAVLPAALLLGLLGDFMLRARPWGINISFWVAALLSAVIIIAHRWRPVLFKQISWLALAALFPAVAFLWRDSWTLNALSLLALLIVFALVKRKTTGGRIRMLSMADYGREFAFTLLHTVLGFARLLLENIKWSEISRNGWPKSIVPVGRGLLLATPPLFAFTLLLTRADLVFGKMVSSTFHQIFDNFFVHLFFIGIYAGIAGGIVRDLLLQDKETTSGGIHSPSFSLGIVETSMILGSVNLLFLVFVIVQFRYYFGGAATVELTAGLTYAEYARRGFFELVTVSALVLPLLLAIHWLLRKENPKHERFFRLHAGAQLLMLFVIMVSALQRMRLYQREYGMTELRLYTTAFMIWLAFAFIWFALTVLRGQRERFAFGPVVAGLSMFVVLLGLNPDGLIIQTNTERVKTGHGFDANYATSLSADAIPNLITALPALPDSARAVVATHLLKTWGSLKNQDWRTGNYSRLRAKSEIQSRLDYLQGIVLFNKNSSRSEYGQ